MNDPTRPLPHKIPSVTMRMPKDLGAGPLELEDQIYVRTMLNRIEDLIASNIALGEQIVAAKRWTMIAVVFASVVSVFTLLMVWALRHHVGTP